MPGLVLVASARPVFNAGDQTLTFELPELAAKGQLLLIVVAFDPADDYVLPAGWTLLATFVGTAKVAMLARMVDDNEPAEVVLELTTAAEDWLGQLIAYATGSPGVVLEATAGGNFAADATPPAPTADSQQAINLDLRVWNADAAVVLDAPAGYTAIDSYSSAIAAARSLLIATKVANATGALGAKDAAAGAAATGSGVTFVLRDRAPVTPAILFDPVPGNIGFVEA